MWTLGGVLFILVTGCFPYNEISKNDVNFMKLISKNFNTDDIKITKNILHLIYGLCHSEPKKRLQLDKVINFIDIILLSNKKNI